MSFQSSSTHHKVNMRTKKGPSCEASISSKIFQCNSLLVNVHPKRTTKSMKHNTNQFFSIIGYIFKMHPRKFSM